MAPQALFDGERAMMDAGIMPGQAWRPFADHVHSRTYAESGTEPQHECVIVIGQFAGIGIAVVYPNGLNVESGSVSSEPRNNCANGGRVAIAEIVRAINRTP